MKFKEFISFDVLCTVVVETSKVSKKFVVKVLKALLL